jgi:serine phosphatase RsbU (regulator of sigma subunit)
MLGANPNVQSIEDRDRSPGRSDWRPHWQAVTVLLLGVLVTVGLTVSSALSYAHNERRLTALQTRLTASVLQTAQPQLQATLGRVIGLTAMATESVATFRAAMADELAPKGPFASSTLAVVRSGQVQVLDHVGSPAIQSPQASASTQLFLQAARSSSLVTSRVVGDGIQKLGYLMSAPGPDGVYVIGAAQQLPIGRRVAVPAGSPDSNLNFALYFGRSVNPAALVETNVGRLPLRGTVSRATVPFGNNVLTLVASPRSSLAGTWAEYLPWGILGLGILLSVAAAGVAENLVRRRTTAEALYTQQRRMSETLQRSLLPQNLPAIPGWEFATRYSPATKGAEIGGDWYSVVEVDDHRFAVVVGDVSGHDLAAAGVMAGLRYTIRTLAKLGIPPDEILDRTTRELDVTSDEHFATVLVAVVDTRRQELTVASAGHLPPLILRKGRPEFLTVVPGVPVGVPGPSPQPMTVPFTAGSTLVAFTDGLIEQRGKTLDAGLERLAEAAVEGPASPDDLLAYLVTTLAGSDQEDDIAVLAVRFTGQEAKPTTTESVRPGDPLLSQPAST